MMAETNNVFLLGVFFRGLFEFVILELEAFDFGLAQGDSFAKIFLGKLKTEKCRIARISDGTQIILVLNSIFSLQLSLKNRFIEIQK